MLSLRRFHAFHHADMPHMPPHGKAHHNGEQHGQRHCQQIAAGCNGANEHQLIHFYGQDDEPVQRHAQQQAHAGADEGQKLDLAEDVAVHFFVISRFT